MFGDEEYVQQDGKYRGYVAAMEKALKNFEYSSEWPDLIAALGKLSKVISSHSGKYKILPRRLLLSKRLSQCLHPSLPSGVHLKALETYDLVFKSIGKDQLSLELFIYSAGLFPLLNYAGISVRLSLLTIYETHLIPLGEKLVPCLDGFLPAILLGMEETSDFYQRTVLLLDSVKVSVGYRVFFTSLWRCIEAVPATRQPAINYMLNDKESVLGDNFEQIQRALRLCLLDINILVQRASLELLASRNELGDGLELIKAALKTLLRRDSSLNRRLVSWLSNSEKQLVEAIQSLLCENEEDNFRLLVYLFDKSELVSEKILDTILVDIVRSLYIHSGSSYQQRSANLFFTTLHSNLIWDHFYKQLEESIKFEDVSKVKKPGSGFASVSELCLLLAFLIQTESTLDKTYLPTLNQKLLQLVLTNLASLNYSNLDALLQIISSEGETELFNSVYINFVADILFQSQDPEIITTSFDKLIKKRIDLYDSAFDFEMSLSESMESMSTHEKVEFEPISINSQLEIFDCFKRLSTILVKIDDLHINTIKGLLVTSTMVNSEQVQLVSINALVEILPRITTKIDLPTTHCIELMTSFLWNKCLFEQILRLYKFYSSNVERVLITQLDYSKTIKLLKFGQHLENNFDIIVLRCLDDLENVDIVSKAQSESFVFEFHNSVGCILEPLFRIFNDALALAQNVLECNENESEQGPPLLQEFTNSTKTSDGPSIAVVGKNEPSVKTPVTPDKTAIADSNFKSVIPTSQEDEIDSEQSSVQKKATSIPVYVVEASGKFIKEEIVIPKIAGDNEDVDVQRENLPDALLGEMKDKKSELKELIFTSSDTPKIVVTENLEPLIEDENQTDEEFQTSCNDIKIKSDNSSASSCTNSITETTETPTPMLSPVIERVLPPIWKPNLFSIHPYNTHFLIYSKTPDHSRCLYALNMLRNIMATNTRSFLISVATSTSKARQTYFELLMSTLIQLCTTFYKETPECGNVNVHVESMRLLGNILSGLLTIAKGNRSYSSFIGDIFSKLQFQKTVLYTLASLVLVRNEHEDQLTSTENILKLNYSKEFDIIYGEIVRLTTCLIAIESETAGHQPKIRSVSTIKYIPAVQLSRQPLYLDSLLKNLANPALATCHHLTLTSITNALPFYGLEEVGRIVGSVVATVCSELMKDNLSEAYTSKILESLTSITHFVFIEQNNVEKEVTTQQVSSHILYNFVSAFLPMPGSWKEKDLGSATKHESTQPLTSIKVQILPTLLPKLLSTLIHLWKPSLQSKILDLINPIAFNHTSTFIKSLSEQHQEINICVDLVDKMKVIPLPSLATSVFTSIREMTAQEEENQITLLTFFTTYIDKSANASEIWPSVISLIKEGPAMSPKCQIGVFSLFAKMIIDVGVPSAKQEFRDLQEGANKLIESVSSQMSLVEKKQKSNTNIGETLETLSKYLPKVIDILWGADVLPLLTNIVYFLIPHLKTKSAQYKTAVTLIANLSFYSYLRKAWKKEIFEHLLESNFFLFPQNCVQPWKIALDNLFTQDKYTFSELIARVSVPASLNLFQSKEIEYESRAMLLKRLAFVIYSSPKDQYTKYITNIQERIAEGIKMPQLVPIIQSQVFLCFRVLLLRLSPHHLTSLWPIILHEILQVLIQMENDILTRNPNLLQLYLQVCKLLELSLNLPISQLPLFQMHRWAFIGPPTETFTPHLTRLAIELEPHKTSNGVKALRSNKIESLGELYDFLTKCDEPVDIEILENVLECDFVEL